MYKRVNITQPHKQGRIQDFEKAEAGAKRPKKNFRTQVRNCFAPTLFAFLLFWTNFKNFFSHPGAKLLCTHSREVNCFCWHF